MDDQATQLRQLVRRVRHAAAVATGPPVIVVYTASDAALGHDFAQSFADTCSARGITTVEFDASVGASERCDWQLLPLTGGCDSWDHDAWQRASVLIVATHAGNKQVVECYQALKFIAEQMPLPPLELVVQSNSDDAAAASAAERLLKTCHRFLACSVLGVTSSVSATGWHSETITPLIDRLTTMAPVASTSLNSPIAVSKS